VGAPNNTIKSQKAKKTKKRKKKQTTKQLNQIIVKNRELVT
jgi:hypothetical protein